MRPRSGIEERRRRVGVGVRTVAIVLLFAAALLTACATRLRPETAPGLTSSESKWTELRGHRVHYLDSGGPGKTLVILHGFAAYSYPFAGVIDCLPQRLHVVAPDLPGHGFSDGLEAGYTMEAFVSFVHEFVGSMGLSRFTLAGTSMGANIAAHYSVRYPEQVERLVLLSPVGLQGQEGLAARVAECAPLATILSGIVGRGTVRRVLYWVAGGDRTLVTPELVDAYALSLSTRERRACLTSVMCNVIAKSHLEGTLPLIAQPVLIIAGDKDPLVRPNHLAEYQKLLSDGRIEILAGGTHLLQRQFPAQVATLVSDFLQAN